MENQFKENKRYLVSANYSETLLELTVLEISKKGIKIKYDNGNNQWYLKNKFPYLFIEELPNSKQTIQNESHKTQFEDDWYESEEPQFTLKLTEENNIDVKLKSEEKLKLEWEYPPTILHSLTWEEANAYAKELGEGWRLPTIQELKEAYESNVHGFLSRNYWSLSTLGHDTNRVWYLDIWNGERGYDYRGRPNVWVRCVKEVK